MATAKTHSGPTAARVSLAAIAIALVVCTLMGIPRFAQARDVDPQLVGLTDQPDGWFLSYDDPTLVRDIDTFSFDIYEYHAYVEYFRGDFDRYPIYGPWRWRMVPSWVASFTPIEDPAVAFATVSLGFLLIGAVGLIAASARNGLRTRGQIFVGLLYSVSFPMFWYGTSGYVDGSSMALLCVGLYLIQSRRWWLFALLLPVGMLTKETFIIIVPVAAVYLWARARERKDWLPQSVAFGVLALGVFFGARVLWTSPRNLDWYPRLARLGWNLSRPEALGSFVLTCGIIVPLALYGMWRLVGARNGTEEQQGAYKENLHLIAGVVLGLLVALHGFLTAYADGRHAWTTYPFAAILGALVIEKFIEGRRGISTRSAEPRDGLDLSAGGPTQ